MWVDYFTKQKFKVFKTIRQVDINRITENCS